MYTLFWRDGDVGKIYPNENAKYKTGPYKALFSATKGRHGGQVYNVYISF
jgi:hypothetical protein